MATLHEAPGPPETIIDENEVVESIMELYHPLQEQDVQRYCQLTRGWAKYGLSLRLFRRQHRAFILRGLEGIPSGYTALDASKPWLCYWMLHSLDVLSVNISEEIQERTIHTISECQHPEGGFGGGRGQMAHLACTFAAISTLAIIGTPAAYSVIDKDALRSFLMKLKRSDGSFSVHDDGENDVRGAYCAVVSAYLTGTLAEDELFSGTAAFISACQTYEGGFGAVPGAEAHAGYTYCAVAALTILEAFDTSPAVNWAALCQYASRAQCPLTGGFRGRTHKLVDGCYSFWCGALFPMLRRICPAPYFDALGLQKFVLVACQEVENGGGGGGLRDKPAKSSDYYHTCYCLSGLSMAQRETQDITQDRQSSDEASLEAGLVLGDAANLVHRVLPEFNLRPPRVAGILEYFGKSIDRT